MLYYVLYIYIYIFYIYTYINVVKLIRVLIHSIIVLIFFNSSI